jgi:hypothetical protein
MLTLTCVKQRARRARSGQTYVEFLLAMPLLLLILGGVIAFGQLIYTRLATEAAAWSGGRHAVATLDADQGVFQGQQAARYTLDGFALNPNRAKVSVKEIGGWGRGAMIFTQVCYDAPQLTLPYADVFGPQQVCSDQFLPVYLWKSKWED